MKERGNVKKCNDMGQLKKEPAPFPIKKEKSSFKSSFKRANVTLFCIDWLII